MEFATSALLFCQMQSKIHQRASLPDTLSSEYLKDSAQTCASFPPARSRSPS